MNRHDALLSYSPALLALIVACLVPARLVVARDYYLSAEGDDTAAATESAPWHSLEQVNSVDLNPGDRVLLQAGNVFPGSLRLDPDDSGQADSQVLVASYGEGRAVIDAGSGDGVVANGCQHLAIENLVVRGTGRKQGNNGSGVRLAGVANARVDHLEVHGFRLSGVNADGVSDVRITHVHAHDNGFAGISSGEDHLSKRLYVAHCLVENNPGDPQNDSNHSGNGIVIAAADDVLVEYCVARDNGWDMPRDGNGPVGIWCWNTSHIVIQHCVAHDNRSPGWDGGGFDLDGGTRNAILQYNLSYDNDGPGYFVCQYYAAPEMRDNIIRYNISYNDGRKNNYKTALRIASVDDNASRCLIYNNTIYTEHGPAVGFGGKPVPQVVLHNNIFVSTKELVAGDTSNARFAGNLWWSPGDEGGKFGEFRSLAEWAEATGQERQGGRIVGRYADPLLTLPRWQLGDRTLDLPRLPMFRLRPGSPCLGAGLAVPDNGGRDFWGISVPPDALPTIGASQAIVGQAYRIDDNTQVVAPASPVAYSGIYPHTAVSNSHYECGIGALVNRDGRLYFVTYAPHLAAGSSDKLYAVDTRDLSLTTYLDYPGCTDANRYRDTVGELDLIGAAYVDFQGVVRTLPIEQPGDLQGRLTGTAAHLVNRQKVYYMTMEEGLYEVDFADWQNPAITVLRPDGNSDTGAGSHNLPGVHGKGLYTGQRVLVFTNNGAGDGGRGVLAEWDGQGDPQLLASWRIVDKQSQYTEVTSRRGPTDMDPQSNDPIWALGWDDASSFLQVREAESGDWTRFRLPKASYTHDQPGGWYTEWPRIRDVGLAVGYLMNDHGMMYLLPESFSATHAGGISPVATHCKMLVDCVEQGDQVVFAADDASIFENPLVSRSNSNLLFVDKEKLPDYGGTPAGYGGVWVDDRVAANQASDAFLVKGFTKRVVHIAHDSPEPVQLGIEVDARGDGNWRELDKVTVPGRTEAAKGYAYYLLPADLDAEWVRFRPREPVSSLTVYLHLGNAPRAVDTTLVRNLAAVQSPQQRSQGVLRTLDDERLTLELAADVLDAAGTIVDRGYYQAGLNPETQHVELCGVDDPQREEALRTEAAPAQEFRVDSASVVVRVGETDYRFPKGPSEFDAPTASGPRRCQREVVTERSLMNLCGTIYELPRDFEGGGIRRVRPITTHNLDLFDFASWRGMLVLAGVVQGPTDDPHCVVSGDGKAGLWLGNVDDLWKFGPPRAREAPWKDTPVAAEMPSDPYLMTGYDSKQLTLSHVADKPVRFRVQVDFLGRGDWVDYATLEVAPGQTLSHKFADGYSAHWVRVVADTSTTATAWFTYGGD